MKSQRLSFGARWQPWCRVFVVCVLCLLDVTQSAAVTEIPRHPLEIQALREPHRALEQISAALTIAEADHDLEAQALLYLARANACRVIADWACQREAGEAAARTARAARQPVSEIRGLIAEGRGRIALHDFNLAENVLGRTQVLLRQYPSAELAADVDLAYSSLSHLLGKHALAAQYASQGLARLEPGQALAMRVRLLRNRGRAEAQLGQHAQAKASLLMAMQEVDAVSDPKLVAEIELELARIAEQSGDRAAQLARAQSVLGIAQDIGNVQLQGMAQEMSGQALLGAGQLAEASAALRAAAAAFRQLNQRRDELRVVQLQVRAAIASSSPQPVLLALVQRWLELDEQVSGGERAQEGDDFEAQLRYAEQALQVQQWQAKAELEVAQKAAAHRQEMLTQGVLVLALTLLAVLLVLFVMQRRAHRQLGASEARYRVLADNTRDLVVRMRPNGERLYVSPSSQDLLGWSPEEMRKARWELIHPEDRESLAQALRDLGSHDGSKAIQYRTRHRDGSWVWIEALASGVPSAERPGEQEIVYSGRDITARVLAEQALAQAQQRLQAVTDHIPAMIALIDADERYRFVNAVIGKTFGIDPQTMLGRSMREIREAAVYADIREHIAAALRGESVSFEGRAEVAGRVYYYQSNYVPDRLPDGRVQGFYALTFDITQLKNTEHRLAASEARLRLITDNLPALVSYIDRDRRFRFNNATYARWLDRPLAEITGLRVADVYDPAVTALFQPHMDAAFAGTTTNFEFMVPSGRWVRGTYVPDFSGGSEVEGIYGLINDVTVQKAAEAALHQLAQFDTLTGLANRNRFNDKLTEAIARSERSGEPMALAFLDLDHFKSINDTLGHEAGDLVLQEFARRLTGSVRSTDTVARLAGDEFVIILEALDDASAARKIASKIIAVMREPIQIMEHTRVLSTSFGIAIRAPGEFDGAALLRRADQLLYKAKAEGRGRFELGD